MNDIIAYSGLLLIIAIGLRIYLSLREIQSTSDIFLKRFIEYAFDEREE